MNTSIFIHCDYKTLGKINSYLEKLSLPIVFSDTLVNNNVLNSTLVAVIDDLDKFKRIDFEDYSRVFIVTNLKFADSYNRIPISNKKAIKLKSLSYDSCPSEPLKMIFQSILREQNQLKLQNDFILKSIEATLCHEINNPLAIGLGKIHHMKRMPISYEAKEELDEIESSMNRIKCVIKKKLPKFLKEFSGRYQGRFIYFD